ESAYFKGYLAGVLLAPASSARLGEIAAWRKWITIRFSQLNRDCPVFFGAYTTVVAASMIATAPPLPAIRYTRRMLLCPVRNCRMALARKERRLLCPHGHSFDVARSGYINLLQPQERRSNQPGDTAAAVEARRRLHDRGVTGPLLHGIAEIMAAR